MKIELDTYEKIFRKLKECFDISFGNERKAGLISMDEVKKLIYMRRKADTRNHLPENALIEIPENLFEALQKTYISRDSSYVSGPIGCAETPDEQLDGITNMALLMYLSNHLAKQFKFKAHNEENREKRELFNKKERTLLNFKDISLIDIIASTYVLSKTSEEFEDYFSYGNRTDNENQPTFVIDLPYIGQLCVHFGWDENKDSIMQNAKDTAKAILEKKLELGQITEKQLQEITSELEEKGVLPEYEGKLYEYVGAMPIEYIGEKTKNCRRIIGNKLPENINSEDIQKLYKYGLNQRELYYFFIKMGAPKSLLNEVSGAKKMIALESIEKATEDVTIAEFDEAVRDVKKTATEKAQGKMESNMEKNQDGAQPDI